MKLMTHGKPNLGLYRQTYEKEDSVTDLMTTLFVEQHMAKPVGLLILQRLAMLEGDPPDGTFTQSGKIFHYF